MGMWCGLCVYRRYGRWLVSVVYSVLCTLYSVDSVDSVGKLMDGWMDDRRDVGSLVIFGEMEMEMGKVCVQ